MPEVLPGTTASRLRSRIDPEEPDPRWTKELESDRRKCLLMLQTEKEQHGKGVPPKETDDVSTLLKWLLDDYHQAMQDAEARARRAELRTEEALRLHLLDPATQQRLEEIQTRDDRASDGPWSLTPSGWTRRGMPLYHLVGPDLGREHSLTFADGEFIIEARNDIPWMRRLILSLSEPRSPNPPNGDSGPESPEEARPLRRIRLRQDLIQPASSEDGHPDMLIASRGTEGEILGPAPKKSSYDLRIQIRTTRDKVEEVLCYSTEVEDLPPSASAP